jgi:hypothetical protein
VDRLLDAFVDASRRKSWLLDGALRERIVTRPRSARFDQVGGEFRGQVSFAARGDAGSLAAVEHARRRRYR